MLSTARQSILYLSHGKAVKQVENKSFLCRMGQTRVLLNFLTHYHKAKRWDAFHSPFLYALFMACCDETQQENAFKAIETQRRKFKSSGETLQLTDLGAGSSSSGPVEKKSIGNIARHALSLPFQGRFLYRLAGFVHPSRIIELGTSLGITTAYMAMGAKQALVDTVEGDPAIANQASGVFKTLGIDHVKLHQMSFAEFLEHESGTSQNADLVFIDGHHTSRALLSYYESLKTLMHSKTILVVDDIYWSADMHQGWQHLIARPEVTQSVDCYHFGLIFFSQDFMDKANHLTRLPWRMQMT